MSMMGFSMTREQNKLKKEWIKVEMALEQKKNNKHIIKILLKVAKIPFLD